MLFPVVNTAEEFTKALAEDLSSRGVIASSSVVYGSGQTLRQEEAPRICVELATSFSSAPWDGGRVTPGPGMRATVTSQPIATRSLMTISEQIIITCLAKVPEEALPNPVAPRGDDPARIAQLAACQLRARVLAAIYRIYMSGIRYPIPGEWLDIENAEFQYGAAFRLYLNIDSQVPDDATWAVQIQAVEATAKAGRAPGDYVAATITAPDP